MDGNQQHDIILFKKLIKIKNSKKGVIFNKAFGTFFICSFIYLSIYLFIHLLIYLIFHIIINCFVQ